jgi:hypothetical protein
MEEINNLRSPQGEWRELSLYFYRKEKERKIKKDFGQQLCYP